MMKSFFKKLAFVMALAMVVSAMAPAATAKAATVGNILRQEATSWTDIKTTDVLEVDATQDYKFGGAPSDWRSLGLKWESSKTEIATVDQTGLVKAVAAGETVISVKGEGFEAAMTLTVKAKEPEVVVPAFTVAQKTANTAVLTFADSAAATKDITVVKVISTVDGDKPMPVVLNASKTKLEGNTVTIEPWVAFGTATYLVTAAGETQKLETSVGNPAKATIDYKEPYTFAEAKKAAAVTLKVTDAKGVELTSGYTVYYEIVESNPAGYAYVNSSTGALNFYVDNASAKVKATIRYTVNNKQESFSVTKEVKSAPMPTVEVIPALDYTAVINRNSVVADANTSAEAKKDAIVWGSSQIKIDDGSYQVVGLIGQTDGKSFSINEYSKGSKDENKNVLDANKTTYKFTFMSTDTSKVVVDKNTGELKGVNTTETNVPAYILVTMQTKVNGSFNDGVIVAAVPVDVLPKKAAQYTTLGADNAAILLTEGDFTTKEVTPKTYNQYGEEMEDTIKEVSATYNNKTHKLANVAGQKKFTIDAEEVNTFFNVGSDYKNNYFIYKVTMNSGKTADFYLTLKEVNDDNRTSLEYKLDVKGAVVKADKLAEKISISVTSMVLGEKFGSAEFFYGKPDVSAEGLKKGSLFVIVKDKDGNVVTPATAGALTTKYENDALAVKEGELKTLPTGVYTVDLYTIMDIIEDTENDKIVLVEAPLQLGAYYTVDNQLPSAATDVKLDLSKKLVVSNGAVTMVQGAVTFKVNGADKDGTAAYAVDAVVVGDSDKVFVYGLKVRHTVGAGYVEIYVPVNQTFDVQGK